MRMLISLFLLAALALPAEAHQVCSVHDGDTFTLCRSKQRVRINRIDAPELSQPFGTESRDALARMILHREVVLNCQRTRKGAVKKDRYGRWLCSPVVNGADISESLVLAGLALDYFQYSHGFYARAEAQARAARRGVWSQPGGGVRPWNAPSRTKNRASYR